MTIVYTAILGGCDSLKPAPVGADRCVCFTDDPEHVANAHGLEHLRHGWDIQWWPRELWEEVDPRREAWRLRCLVHELFPLASTSVWVDASFTVTNLPMILHDAVGYDVAALAHAKRRSCYEEGAEIIRVGQAGAVHVQAQMDAYRRVGFKPSWLTTGCMLVRTHSPQVEAFNLAWDTEIRVHLGDNCQLSLDYCAWKVGLRVGHLEGVRHDNPYAVHDHADHKRRRQPYQSVVPA